MVNAAAIATNSRSWAEEHFIVNILDLERRLEKRATRAMKSLPIQISNSEAS
jgi:hypothetical protein